MPSGKHNTVIAKVPDTNSHVPGGHTYGTTQNWMLTWMAVKYTAQEVCTCPSNYGSGHVAIVSYPEVQSPVLDSRKCYKLGSSREEHQPCGLDSVDKHVGSGSQGSLRAGHSVGAPQDSEPCTNCFRFTAGDLFSAHLALERAHRRVQRLDRCMRAGERVIPVAP